MDVRWLSFGKLERKERKSAAATQHPTPAHERNEGMFLHLRLIRRNWKREK